MFVPLISSWQGLPTVTLAMYQNPSDRHRVQNGRRGSSKPFSAQAGKC